MGQRDVIDALDCEDWITTGEIQKRVDFLSTQSITESLRRLNKKGIVEYKKNPECGHGYLYRLK